MERRSADRLPPLFLVISVYFIAWMDLYLPQPPLEIFSPTWFAFLAAKNLLRIVFLLAIMGKGEGFKVYELGISGFLPTSKDIANAVLVAASAGVIAVAAAVAAFSFGISNPLIQPFAQASRVPIAILFMLLSSLGVGYSEELFFRFFAPANLEKAGFTPVAAILASSALFGISHSSQGLIGMIGTGFLGLVFSYFRTQRKGIHALALGHAVYDFIILLALT
jgi:membrane protease YdiL (CAAX protease family)